MEDTITISRQDPPINSMDFRFLKEEGIRRIQELAGKIWTDYNEHDPGVTFLEVLCYAITDLGYRTTFDMKDLLASNPLGDASDEYSFFTARRILHNNPVTLQDYRKLLMDVSLVIDQDGNEVSDTENCDFSNSLLNTEDKKPCEIIGIKNAWLEVSKSSEYAIFSNVAESRLSFSGLETSNSDPLQIGVLYDIVLEFSDSNFLGDLNLDTTEFDFPIYHPSVQKLLSDPSGTHEKPTYEYDLELFEKITELFKDPENIENIQQQTNELREVQVQVNVEFPRWDEAGLNWNDIYEIKKAIKKIELIFIGLPENMEIVYRLDDGKTILDDPRGDQAINDIWLASGREDLKDRAVPFLEEITNRINCLVLGTTDSVLKRYQNKVLAILSLLSKARARLNAHRNICEDFFQFNALRVEEVLVCADIEIEANANVNEVEGTIFYQLDRFLSPTVNFYSLEEILQKDLENKKYGIQAIDRGRKIITTSLTVSQQVISGDIVSLSGFEDQAIEYTVESFSSNELNSNFTDIEIREDLTTASESEDSFLFIGSLSEEKLRLSEEVFEGPALENGFIDEDELVKADRLAFVNASDIINLIMDVDGVIAVKTLQIANSPQDDNPEIKKRSVRWCLELAINDNYVPRLSRQGSRMTFFKDGLPFTASILGSDQKFDELKASERDPKPSNPTLDFKIPKGEYRSLSEYTSVQDDLPAFYGVGPEGIPMNLRDEEEIRLTKVKTKQLKGFLMIFDQLLANYLEQLDHVKHLFSFNPLKKENVSESDPLPPAYNFQVDKTYYSQPIYEIVSNSLELYFSLEGKIDSEEDIKRILENELQPITEDILTFQARRNKFLDHLLGRFGEQFDDYTMLAERLEVDKVDFGRFEGQFDKYPNPKRKIEEASTGLELIEDKQDFLSRYPDLSANRGKAFDYKSPLYWFLDNSSGLEKRSSFLTGIDPTELSDLVFDPRRIRVKNGNGHYFEVFKELENDKIVELRGSEKYPSEIDLSRAIEKIILYGTCEENYQVKCKKVNKKNEYFIFLMDGGKQMAYSTTSLQSEGEARDVVQTFIEVFKEEFFENPLSNRKNLTLPFNSYFEGNVEDTDTATQRYNISYQLFSSPYKFSSGNLLLNGSLEGEVSYRDDELNDEIDDDDLKREIEREAQNKIRSTYWDIVFYGGRLCLYVQSGDHVLITDNLGQEIARGEISKINELLSDESITRSLDENEELTEFEKATNKLTAFFERHFFRQEGLHLVEHVLLRPKVNNVWVDADTDDVKKIPEQNVFISVIDPLTTSAKVENGQVIIPGGLADEATRKSQLLIQTAPNKAHKLEVVKASERPIAKGNANDQKTKDSKNKKQKTKELKETVLETALFPAQDFEGQTALTIGVRKLVQVANILDSDDEVPPILELETPSDLNLFQDDNIIRLTDAEEKISYGEFAIEVKRASDDDPVEGVILRKFKLQDRLLPIYIPNAENDIEEPDEEERCDDCKIENPYSFIAQVVVAGWPGRFDNKDFRDFFERTLQLEAPAHLFLNICWIGYDQMEVFERRYKTWILANLKNETVKKCEGVASNCSNKEKDDLEALSKAQNELVEIIYELRNVYPVKTLHDCDEGESTEGAIILNQTALGEI